MQLLRTCAAWRPDPVAFRDPVMGAKIACKSLARRLLELGDEIAGLDRMIDPLVHELAPALVELEGIGTHNAAELLIVAGDNPDRLGSEGGFAMLCGVAPIPASSGKTVRHRLNRDATARPTAPSTWSASAPCAPTNAPATTSPAASPRAAPSARSSVASSVTSPATSTPPSRTPPPTEDQRPLPRKNQLTNMRASTAANTSLWRWASACARREPRPRWARRARRSTNAVVESFFSSLKRELVNRYSWPTKDDARVALFEWVEAFSNRTRLHTTLGNYAPEEFERLSLTKEAP